MALSSPPLQNLSSLISSQGIATATARAPSRRFLTVQAAASDTTTSLKVSTFKEGKLVRLKWTGETLISRLVRALISFKPLYSILKLGARQVIISTAEKNNIPWREMTKAILESDVYKELDSIQNKSLVYPDYYLNPFHAYDEGNLTWLAAAEAEAATKSMVRRAIPTASSVDEATQILRGNWLNVIEQHHLQYSQTSTIDDILDIGCSVGVSSRYLANKFPSAKVTGLDLSPYFLSVAQHKEKRGTTRKNPIKWIHANGEDKGLPSKSFDLVSIAYVFHECPTRAIVNVVKEAFRLLRPGGMLAMTDNSPKSKVLQIIMARVYVSIAKMKNKLELYQELQSRLKESQHALSDAISDSDLHHRLELGGTGLLQSLVVLNGKPVPLVIRPARNVAEKWDALLYRHNIEGDSQDLDMLLQEVLVVADHYRAFYAERSLWWLVIKAIGIPGHGESFEEY